MLTWKENTGVFRHVYLVQKYVVFSSLGCAMRRWSKRDFPEGEGCIFAYKGSMRENETRGTFLENRFAV